MDVAERRAAPSEKQRSEDLVMLFPASGGVALDIGARDGHYSVLLAERFERVIALDLEKPEVTHPRVQCVAGNAAHLEFEDDSIDFVLCAEVLEHIPTAILAKVCREIERVSKDRFLIGVPYRQDIRVGRTTCSSCGKTNPPWGHINSFDEDRLRALFPGSRATKVSMVGKTIEQTNALASQWMHGSN
jgi:cyclopropane fatty-acyl-phospholipid synthase-like methyltransferase